MTLKKLIPVTAAVVAFAALGSGQASAAEAIDPIDLGPIECAVAPADATLWLGQGTPMVQASSTGLYYASSSRACRYFVVDVNVPAHSPGGKGYNRFSIEATGGHGCELYSEWRWLYRRYSSRDPFAYVGHVAQGGDSIHDCDFVTYEGHDPWPSSFAPPASGVATYRVLTYAYTRPHYFSTDHLWPQYVKATHQRL